MTAFLAALRRFADLASTPQDDESTLLKKRILVIATLIAPGHPLSIGDCCMVASGVPRPRPDHAQALVRMAQEMQDYVRDNAFLGRRLSFRIGINSGPVDAGVIGRRKFIYDLWGDAVNPASRMESHGSGGTIQIAQETCELIRYEFECESRGVSPIKGKGEMVVWSVLGARG